MKQPLRIDTQGARIDRSKPLDFRFDGRAYQGYAGDTLASALLANGVRVTGRSFKYHRPRGVMAAGFEEPNTLVQVGLGARTEPNLRATQIELTAGLDARAVNCAPSARWDWRSVLQWLKPFMPAGFYYKTFMAPSFAWYERAIRNTAGLGRAPAAADPDRYEKRSADCEVLVIGAGGSGLAAAQALAGQGRDVLLVHDGPGIEALAGLRTLARTTVFGYYDHDHLVAIEQRPGAPARQRLWRIRAREVVLATGAIERPLVFPNNDRPGVMLAGAARAYLRDYGVIPGQRVVVATNNDSAYDVALHLLGGGVRVAAIADLRASPHGGPVERARAAGITLLAATAPTNVRGAHGVRAVELHGVDAAGRAQPGTRAWIDADALLVSGGWNPTVHLHSQAGGKLRFDAARQAFVPEAGVQSARSVGSAAGEVSAAAPIWEIDVTPLGRSGAKSWVDFASDVTAEDLRLALRENFRSVEHVKRYTTTGMATDQGKTSNVNAIGIVARSLATGTAQVGTTRFRPPFTPVTLGAITGRRVGAFYRPVRHLPAHDAHAALGAAIEEYGGWLRPAFYPRSGEDERAAVAREMQAVRRSAGLFDASPLGKILVAGKDAAEFLHRMYLNNIRSLEVGRCRYGVMLGEDGVVLDDGVCSRLAPDQFLVGTTTGAAGRIHDWLEEWLQCEWVDLEVVVENVTTQWAVMTVAGPKAREMLRAAGVSIDLSPEAFPHMSVRTGTLRDWPVRVMRVSFTGELSYEISVPASQGSALWELLLQAGKPLGAVPYGVEATLGLRLEKGYIVVGAESDGTTLPQDLGLGPIIEKKREDFVGRRSTMTPEGRRADRRQLVGLRSTDAAVTFPVGAHVVGPDFQQAPYLTQGYVTSSIFSPTLERAVALALVSGGRGRIGEAVQVYHEGRCWPATLTDPVAYDPPGQRLHA